MKFTHMAICEVMTDEHVAQIVTKMQDHVRNIPGLVGHSILAEEGGRMVVLVTDWPSRQDCLQYHASREYRQFIVASQEMLVGNYDAGGAESNCRHGYWSVPLLHCAGRSLSREVEGLFQFAFRS